MSHRTRAALRGAILALVVAPAAQAHKPDNAKQTSKKLRAAITQKGALKHLRAQQDVADTSGGNRASGFDGYGGSVQ